MYQVPDTIKSELNFVAGQERKHTNSQGNHDHDKTGILITRADKINKYRLERDGKEDHYYYYLTVGVVRGKLLSLSCRSCMYIYNMCLK